MADDEGEIVCDFCGTDWRSSDRWYWTNYGISYTDVADYCGRCADALPKLIADLRASQKLQERHD
jgi:hypothetical protein